MPFSSNTTPKGFDSEPKRRGAAVGWTAGAATLLVFVGFFVFMLLPGEFEKTVPFTPGATLYSRAPLLGEPEAGVWSAALSIKIPEPTKRLSGMGVYFHLSEAERPVRSAKIEIPELGCVLAAQNGSVLRGRNALLFRPTSPACATERTAKRFDATLTVVLEPGEAPPLSLVLDHQDPVHVRTDRNAAVNGWFLYQPALGGGCRFGSLARMWGFDEAGPIMGGLMLVAAAVGSLGAGLFASGAFASGTSTAGVRPFRREIGAALAALSLGLAYAVIVPPFQAPDEPSHFFSFVQTIGRQRIANDAKHLAMTAHFERIRRHAEQKFTPDDALEPFDRAWAEDVIDSGMARRSPLTLAAWRALLGVVHFDRAAPALMTMRVLGALGFAAALPLGCLLAAWAAGKNRRPPGAAFFVFIAPALPFFAVHVSNYAFIVMAAVFWGRFALALLERDEDGAWLGPVVGFCMALVFALGPLGASLGPFIVCFALSRPFWTRPGCNPDEVGGAVRRAVRFWFGALVGFAPAFFLPDSQPTSLLAAPGEALAGFLPLLKPVSPLVASAALCTLAALGAVLVESATSRFLLRIGALGRARVERLGVGALWVALAAFSGLFVVAPFMTFSPSPSDAAVLGSSLAYGRVATVTLLNGLSLRVPDHLLSGVFWGGFGWHDAGLPALVVRLLAGAAGLGLIVRWHRAARSGDGRAAIKELCYWLGVGAAAFASAVGAVKSGLPNVHGRYCIIIYCLTLALSFRGLGLLFFGAPVRDGVKSEGRVLAEYAVALAPVLLHGYCFFMLADRWLG